MYSNYVSNLFTFSCIFTFLGKIDMGFNNRIFVNTRTILFHCVRLHQVRQKDRINAISNNSNNNTFIL